MARGLERREKEGPGALETGQGGQGWGCPGRSHTQQLWVCSSQQLIEDMEVPLPFELLHHSGLLKQIWERGREGGDIHLRAQGTLSTSPPFCPAPQCS